MWLEASTHSRGGSPPRSVTHLQLRPRDVNLEPIQDLELPGFRQIEESSGSLPAQAADPPLMCFGNEPSWSVALETPGTARLVLPDEPPAEYRGTSTRIEVLHERVWRGRLGSGTPDLVVFLREVACSDGMSDVKHPVEARVSLPDGRFLAGCCRITSAPTAAPVASEAAPPRAPAAQPRWLNRAKHLPRP